MVGWFHKLKGHEFEQAPGDGEGQGSLVCCSPWSHKKSQLSDWKTTNHPGSTVVKDLPANSGDARDWLISLLEDPLEKEMTSHSSILSWKIPWTEEAGWLQSMGSQSQTRLSTLILTAVPIDSKHLSGISLILCSTAASELQFVLGLYLSVRIATRNNLWYLLQAFLWLILWTLLFAIVSST